MGEDDHYEDMSTSSSATVHSISDHFQPHEFGWGESITRWTDELGFGLLDAEEVVRDVFTYIRGLPEEKRTPGKIRRNLHGYTRDHVTAHLLLLARGDSPRARPALDRMLAIWSPEVLRWCRMLADSKCAPDDAAQDVLLTFVRRMDSVREPTRVRHWLWGTTWRIVRGYQRQAWVRRWIPTFGDADADRGIEDFAGAERGDDMLLSIRAVLNQLSAEHRQLLWLVYAEGATRQEVCEAIGMAEGTLNRKLTAARRAFEAKAAAAGVSLEALTPTPPDNRLDFPGAR